jgi:D-amino-acid dehydrogenase
MRVVVVGAGIFGASAAYHLAMAGAEVEVIDEAHEGKATMAGAGIVCPWATRNPDAGFYPFYATSGEYYPKLVAGLAERGETDFGYKRTGALVISDVAADIDAIDGVVRQRTAAVPAAGTISRLSGKDVQKLFPPLRDDFEAVHIAGGARVEARGLAAAMLRAAAGLGAIVRKGHAGLVVENGKARCLDADGRPVGADRIVVTAGAWASQILAPAGVPLPVVPQKGQIIHLRLEGTDTSRWPVILPLNSYYMLAFDDSRVVIGATRETGSGFDYRVTAGGQAEVLNFGLAFAPGLQNASLIETRIGFRPAATDAKPILGKVPGVDNLVIGNGLGAGGLTMGPFAGKVVAAMALEEDPGIDLSPFAIAA